MYHATYKISLPGNGIVGWNRRIARSFRDKRSEDIEISVKQLAAGGACMIRGACISRLYVFPCSRFARKTSPFGLKCVFPSQSTAPVWPAIIPFPRKALSARTPVIRLRTRRKSPGTSRSRNPRRAIHVSVNVVFVSFPEEITPPSESRTFPGRGTVRRKEREREVINHFGKKERRKKIYSRRIGRNFYEVGCCLIFGITTNDEVADAGKQTT